MSYESVLVVLATGGAPLEGDALDGLPGTTVTWQRIEREGRVACLAARVSHADPLSDFRMRVRQWGAAPRWGGHVWPRGVGFVDKITTCILGAPLPPPPPPSA